MFSNDQRIKFYDNRFILFPTTFWSNKVCYTFEDIYLRIMQMFGFLNIAYLFIVGILYYN